MLCWRVLKVWLLTFGIFRCFKLATKGNLGGYELCKSTEFLVLTAQGGKTMAQFDFRTMFDVAQGGGQQTFECLLTLDLGRQASKPMALVILIDVSGSTGFTEPERLMKDDGRRGGLTVMQAINHVLP